MSLVWIALPVALLLGALAVAAWWWAARSGQFDDLETPRHRALWEEEPAGPAADDPPADQKA